MGRDARSNSTRKRSKSKGDCLRQCVARVTNRAPGSVPDFVGKYKGRWSYYLSVWCKRTGHWMALFPTRQLHNVTIAGSTPHNVIAIGPGKHNPKGCHAVVLGRKGNETYNGGNPLKRQDRLLIIGRTDHA